MNGDKAPRPNGKCWDDCGGEPGRGSFFLQGHDKRAERYLVAVDGAKSIAERVAAHGFTPGTGEFRAATLASDASYEECGRLALNGQPCQIIGRGRGMQVHRAADDRHLPE